MIEDKDPIVYPAMRRAAVASFPNGFFQEYARGNEFPGRHHFQRIRLFSDKCADAGAGLFRIPIEYVPQHGAAFHERGVLTGHETHPVTKHIMPSSPTYLEFPSSKSSLGKWW